MLYKIDLDEEPSSALRPLPFYGMSAVEKLEKDLENIIAKNLEDVLFEETRLLPIRQERQGQGVADLYAVNPSGDLVLFELKRGTAGEGAIQQLLRYSQDAGRWRYGRLDEMYREYLVDQEEGAEPSSLRDAHGDYFGIEEPLQAHEFNQHQHLRVIGNAADEDLVKAVDYWKQHGLKIDFVPYRLYDFGDGNHYFEFFSLPYDRHLNPGDRKGVLFDTNASYDTESVWEMMEGGKVAAYGGAKEHAQRVSRKDIVFFYHKGQGIVAAGEVTSSSVKKIRRDGYEEWYQEVDFLTPTPSRDEGLVDAVSPGEIEEITGKSFWWARTIKRPHLDAEEAEGLLEEVRNRLSN